MITSRPFDILWPHIEDEASAKDASRLGVLAAIVAAIWYAALITYGISEGGHLGLVRVSPGGYLSTAVFLFLAFGIARGWRAAAVIAPILFLLVQSQSPVGLNGWMAGVVPWLIILTATVTVFFVSGVRGTFARWSLHRASGHPRPAHQRAEARGLPVHQEADPENLGGEPHSKDRSAKPDERR